MRRILTDPNTAICVTIRKVRQQATKNDLFVIFVVFCANPVCTIRRTDLEVVLIEKSPRSAPK
jgi:hypothetical protein